MTPRTKDLSCCRSNRLAWVRFLLAAGLAAVLASAAQAGPVTREEVSEVAGAGWSYLEEVPNGCGVFGAVDASAWTRAQGL
jgi:opacity protein-like surface antigen